MKKIVIALVVVCIAATMMFVGVSCATTTETTAAGAETTAAGAETTAAGAETTEAAVAGKELTIALVPKVVHPWFDIVNIGAQEMAKTLSENTTTKVTVNYIAPATADVAEQNMILQNAAATQVDGIIIDPLDVDGSAQVFEEIKAQGIMITLFDLSPFDDWTSVCATDVDMVNFELNRLMELIGEKGKVAVMQGFPTAPSHKQRYDLFMEKLKDYPNVTVVDGGVDNDDMETARQQASATIAANPDLAGYLVCDAAGPVGVGQAIKEAGKVGEIQCVGLGEMTSILDLVKEGVLESTVYIYPDMQGSYSVLLHYMHSLGMPIPKMVDMGVTYIDKTNVDEYIDRFTTTG
ncbi:MAG: sugar ABC transporter substrate-binding protein [Alphaproteobacteria bacterium]|nr:MAG: sugar ABC transporter substrate-binding protein [Alphaproteobacteria bacterium]